MKDPIVVIGLGEMAGVFTRGFLKLGYPVFPLLRNDDMEAEAKALVQPALVLVSVGESDLHATLEKIPAAWHDRIGLLQNELLPRDWQAHNLSNPTVISVWFEKKRGQEFKVLVPSPAYGPAAPLLEAALEKLGIPCWELKSAAELEFELVRKNLYILTTNIAGLSLPEGSNVDALWSQHQGLAREVANEVMDIQFRLIGRELDRARLIAGMVEGIKGDLHHTCTGRTAGARLTRALQHAERLRIAAPRLHAIAIAKKC